MDGATYHGRSPGVFVHGATTIVGDIILADTNPEDTDADAEGNQMTACKEGLYFMPPSRGYSHHVVRIGCIGINRRLLYQPWSG